MSDLRCFVVEVTCEPCRARLRRQLGRDAMDALAHDARCPKCGAHLSVISILGTATTPTDWERVRPPEDAMSWMDQRDAGMRHCE